eukprot:4612741-Pyramimonas_sp.AAC.1
MRASALRILLHSLPPPMRASALRMPILAHPSHGSWPHRELRRRPQWQSSHAVPRTFRHTPHTARGH